jgi:hypothetical protein
MQLGILKHGLRAKAAQTIQEWQHGIVPLGTVAL